MNATSTLPGRVAQASNPTKQMRSPSANQRADKAVQLQQNSREKPIAGQPQIIEDVFDAKLKPGLFSQQSKGLRPKTIQISSIRAVVNQKKTQNMSPTVGQGTAASTANNDGKSKQSFFGSSEYPVRDQSRSGTKAMTSTQKPQQIKKTKTSVPRSSKRMLDIQRSHEVGGLGSNAATTTVKDSSEIIFKNRMQLSSKKGGFDRLNLTANLQGISGLAKSSTIGPTPKEAVANMSNTMMIALNQSNDHSHKGADRQSDEGGNNVSSSINSSSLGLNGKLKKRVSKQKSGNSEAPQKTSELRMLGHDLLSLLKSDFNNTQNLNQHRVPVSTRNVVNKSLLRKSQPESKVSPAFLQKTTPIKEPIELSVGSRRLSLATAKNQQMKTYQSQSSTLRQKGSKSRERNIGNNVNNVKIQIQEDNFVNMQESSEIQDWRQIEISQTFSKLGNQQPQSTRVKKNLSVKKQAASTIDRTRSAINRGQQSTTNKKAEPITLTHSVVGVSSATNRVQKSFNFEIQDNDHSLKDKLMQQLLINQMNVQTQLIRAKRQKPNTATVPPQVIQNQTSAKNETTKNQALLLLPTKAQIQDSQQSIYKKPHAHAQYFESAAAPLKIGGTTAITTQGGNTVININIGSNVSNPPKETTPKIQNKVKSIKKSQLDDQTVAIFNRLLQQNIKLNQKPDSKMMSARNQKKTPSRLNQENFISEKVNLVKLTNNQNELRFNKVLNIPYPESALVAQVPKTSLMQHNRLNSFEADSIEALQIQTQFRQQPASTRNRVKPEAVAPLIPQNLQIAQVRPMDQSQADNYHPQSNYQGNSPPLSKVQHEIQQSVVIPELLPFPMGVRQCLKQYARSGQLTDFEKTELLEYQTVYFIGLPGIEKIQGKPGKTCNYGFDDDQGDYRVIFGDHLAFRFEIIDFLGKGSFGQAIKCKDHKTQEIVAVKIIRNKLKFKHQAGVELNILMHLRDNDPEDAKNIIRIKDHCEFRSHLLISFELFSVNLYEFIKGNNFQGVSLSLIRRFAIQILQALRYLQTENIIHCDLKPENILLKSQDKSGIKIIDFGSSCFSDQRIYTYIQSRFYRAPEIVLGIPYTTAIDMWSFGCILVELYTGIPIFPGESEHEQLSLIIQVIGLPDEDLLRKSSRRENFFEPDSNQLAYDVEDSSGQIRIPNTKPLIEIVTDESQTFLQFLSEILVWDPQARIQPFEALQHPWITEGLPPKVLIHHQRMLGLDVPSSSQSSDQMQELQEPSVQQRANNLMGGESIERPSHILDLEEDQTDQTTVEPKMSQTQPLSQQLKIVRQKEPNQLFYASNKMPQKPVDLSKTANIAKMLRKMDPQGN